MVENPQDKKTAVRPRRACRAREEFSRLAQQKRTSLIVEFWYFLKHNKKWWLLPMLIILLLLGLLILLGGTAIAPFIYPLF